MTDPLTATDYANRTSPDTPISNAAVCSVATGRPLVPLEVAQALERDARRYKWIREHERLVAVSMARLCGDGSPGELDAAIDAAMKEKPRG